MLCPLSFFAAIVEDRITGLELHPDPWSAVSGAALAPALALALVLSGVGVVDLSVDVAGCKSGS